MSVPLMSAPLVNICRFLAALLGGSPCGSLELLWRLCWQPTRRLGYAARLWPPTRDKPYFRFAKGMNRSL